MKPLLTLLFLFPGVLPHVLAQDQSGRSVVLMGKMTEVRLTDSVETVLPGATVEIWARGELLSSVKTGNKGRYSCMLPYFNTYLVKYLSDGFVTKMVEVDATDFAQETRERGFTLEVDITLFRSFAGCRDFEFLGEVPVARARFNKRENTVVWDQDYVERINNRIRLAAETCGK